jgi:aspartate racemase
MDYYKFINEGVNAKLVTKILECIIYSLNFGDIQAKVGTIRLTFITCLRFKKRRAVYCVYANTAHLWQINYKKINLSIIHIGAETAKAVNKAGFKKVGLLGTKFTMEMPFYRNKLEEYGLEVLTPKEQETRDYIQHTVKEELGIGFINPETKKKYISIVKELVENGAECIILGCTEIPMLISQDDFEIPIFDTTKIHSQAIVEYIVSEK